MITQDGYSRLYDRLDAVLPHEFRKLVSVDSDGFLNLYLVKMGEYTVGMFAAEPVNNDTTEEGTRYLDAKIRRDIMPNIQEVLLKVREKNDRQNRQEPQAEDEVQKDPTAAHEAQPDGSVRQQGAEAGDTVHAQDHEPAGWFRPLRKEVARLMRLWLALKWEDFKSLFVRRKAPKAVNLKLSATWVPAPDIAVTLSDPNVSIMQCVRTANDGAPLHYLVLRAKQGGALIDIMIDEPLELMHEAAGGYRWQFEQDALTRKTPANTEKTEV